MDHALALPLLIGLVALALAFDFLNGLHDAANSIATVVSTRLLSPVAAVSLCRIRPILRLIGWLGCTLLKPLARA